MSAEAPEGCSIDSQGVSQAQSLSAEESSFMPGLGSAVSSRWKGGDLPGTGPEDYGAGKRVYGGVMVGAQAQEGIPTMAFWRKCFVICPG